MIKEIKMQCFCHILSNIGFSITKGKLTVQDQLCVGVNAFQDPPLCSSTGRTNMADSLKVFLEGSGVINR